MGQEALGKSKGDKTQKNGGIGTGLAKYKFGRKKQKIAMNI